VSVVVFHESLVFSKGGALILPIIRVHLFEIKSNIGFATLADFSGARLPTSPAGVPRNMSGGIFLT
jgi:hypothetical protein